MEIFNIKELSKHLNCSISSIRTLVRNKEIPFFRIGNKLHFSKRLIDEWIYSQSTNNLIKQK